MRLIEAGAISMGGAWSCSNHFKADLARGVSGSGGGCEWAAAATSA